MRARVADKPHLPHLPHLPRGRQKADGQGRRLRIPMPAYLNCASSLSIASSFFLLDAAVDFALAA